MILFINACVRKESRTKALADALLSKLNGAVKEVRLEEIRFPMVDAAFLEARDRLIAEQSFDHPLFTLAREFSEADTIVVAAPFWDLSFPAILKQYFEQINVSGVTFRYSPEGIPVGLCKAERLYYVTTAGGPILCDDYGFGYIKALAEGFYGIRDIHCIKAEGLDIDGADADEILNQAKNGVDRFILPDTENER